MGGRQNDKLIAIVQRSLHKRWSKNWQYVPEVQICSWVELNQKSLQLLLPAMSRLANNYTAPTYWHLKNPTELTLSKQIYQLLFFTAAAEKSTRTYCGFSLSVCPSPYLSKLPLSVASSVYAKFAHVMYSCLIRTGLTDSRGGQAKTLGRCMNTRADAIVYL